MTVKDRKRVAILFGGRSAEHEISLLSARFVLESLDRDRFEPVLVGIDKTGRWLPQAESILLSASRDPRLQKLNQSAPEAALVAHASGGQSSITVTGGDPLSVDVVFPVLHGPMGEDGAVQGLLELAQVPYVGAGVLGSAVGMDKDVMKRLLREAEIPVVECVVIRRGEWSRDRDAAMARCAGLGLPLFVKPANLGSSVGIRRVTEPSALVDAIDHAFTFDRKVIVECGIAGVRELECAVLGGDPPIASGVGEIVVDHPDGFYSYDAKYIDEAGARTQIPADVSPAVANAIGLMALRTFEALECEGLARVDFFLAPDGELYVNEINTMPGMTEISMFPKLWQAAGMSSRELITHLIETALAHSKLKPNT